MKLKSIALVIAVCQCVASHTLFTTLFVNDQNQGDGVCVRQPQSDQTATNPVIDLQSKEMVCGFDGERPVDRVCSVPQSAKLSFLYRWWPDESVPGSIDPSHKGPCAVYMKAQGVASDWFKIWDEGYDAKTSQWCTEKLIQNKGLLSVKIPGNLRGGSYLVRTELLTLHNADKSPPEPQFYISCAQIFLNSTGTALPSETIKIPGHVSIKDASVLWNIYEDQNSPYPIPGPKRYISGASPFTNIEPERIQKEGLLPSNAVITNANWWGVEIPGYTDSTSCWKSATDSCWPQVKKCYEVAPPSGHAGCKVWEDKCTALNDICNSPNPKGPVNSGKHLSATVSVYSIPPAENLDVVPTSTVHTTFISITVSPPNVTPTKKAGSAAGHANGGKLLSTTNPTPSTSTQVQIEQFVAQILSPSSTLSTNSQPTSNTLTTPNSSTTGRCGIEGGQATCSGSTFGRCCSGSSYCGNSINYCGGGKCQSGFGECGDWIPALETRNAREKQVKEIMDRILLERRDVGRRHHPGGRF